ncbi:MAG: hypothetical protein JSU77_07670 [Fidelibacterota bacterium]|nr:MAG: hypothetical protein JSU77_07670 [Candidatus Neomarinimicrobiota bacterium]
MQKESPKLARLLPEVVEDWQISGDDQVFNRDNLYDYINGGAELYLSYGFIEMVNRTYVFPDQPDVLVDILDMGTSQNAFGVFAHSRESVASDFGQGSEYHQGYLHFWKDRYVISIISNPETAESKQTIFTLAKEIETAIGVEGPLPDILRLLPEQNLVEESIRYVRDHFWMNSHFFIAEENILNLNDQTDAVLAKYGALGQRSILLLVKYPQASEAEEAYASFIEDYLPELRDEPAIRSEDGSWTSGHLSGNLITIVFNASSQAAALSLVNAVKDNYTADSISSS